MDDHQFDALVRRLSAGPTRRGVLTGLIAGGANLLATDTVSAKRRKKKKKKKGAVATTQPPAPPTTLPPFCAGKPDQTYCGPTPRPPDFRDWLLCSGGACGRVPTCEGFHEASCTDQTRTICCSEYCDLSGRCSCSAAGSPCYNDGDCCGVEIGMNVCVGWVCRAAAQR